MLTLQLKSVLSKLSQREGGSEKCASVCEEVKKKKMRKRSLTKSQKVKCPHRDTTIIMSAFEGIFFRVRSQVLV